MLRIVPECYVDTKIAEIVGRGNYNHQHGCGDVANQLKTKLLNQPALAIIDEDENKGVKAKYLLEFLPISEENNLLLKKHPERLHYLIMVCPEIEKWLLQNAKEVNIDPAEFNLQADLSGLKKATKMQDINKNIDFYRFVKQLIRKEAPGLITLQNWIVGFQNSRLPQEAKESEK